MLPPTRHVALGILLDAVVVGGLLFSQLVTLYLTPVFYTYMAALQEWTQSMRKHKRAVIETPVAG